MMRRERLIGWLRQPDVFIAADGDGFVVRRGEDRRRAALLRLDSLEGLPLNRDGDRWVLDVAAAPKVEVEEVWQTDTDGHNVKRQINRMESPMAWLMRYKDKNSLAFLKKRHLAALDKLRDDHLTGYAQPGLTSNWNAAGGGRGSFRSGDDPHVFRLAARQRCREALATLSDELRVILERVCLEGTALGVVERGLQLPRRSAKHHVRAALDRLARYYGH